MSEIIDLKCKNKTTPMPQAVGGSSKESYPWGLKISLNDDSIDKLGLDISKLKTGQPYKGDCEYIVTSISQNDYEGKISNEVSLQITGMSMPKKVSTDRLQSGKDILNRMRSNK